MNHGSGNLNTILKAVKNEIFYFNFRIIFVYKFKNKHIRNKKKQTYIKKQFQPLICQFKYNYSAF